LHKPEGAKVIAISGRIGAGKTTLATHLAADMPATLVRTRDLLHQAAGSTHIGRVDLQVFGRRLDVQTDGRWVADAVRAEGGVARRWVVVDAVRISPQVEALRQFADTFHIHLTAPTDVLAARYVQKQERPQKYVEVSADPTEMRVDTLMAVADLVLDTQVLDADRVRALALEALRSFAV
jgi:adenylosuccinate synthase